jgi:hypothetical protein
LPFLPRQTRIQKHAELLDIPGFFLYIGFAPPAPFSCFLLLFLLPVYKKKDWKIVEGCSMEFSVFGELVYGCGWELWKWGLGWMRGKSFRAASAKILHSLSTPAIVCSSPRLFLLMIPDFNREIILQLSTSHTTLFALV